MGEHPNTASVPQAMLVVNNCSTFRPSPLNPEHREALLVCKKVHVHPELCAFADEQLSAEGGGFEISGSTELLLIGSVFAFTGFHGLGVRNVMITISIIMIGIITIPSMIMFRVHSAARPTRHHRSICLFRVALAIHILYQTRLLGITLRRG